MADETKETNEPMIWQSQQEVDETNDAMADKPLIQRGQQVDEAVVVDNANGTAKADDVTDTADELD